MRIAVAGWIGSALMAGTIAVLWHPLGGVALCAIALAVRLAANWVGRQRHMQSTLANRAVSAALSTNTDAALLLFDGGRHATRRSALIAAQLDPQDLAVPLDGDVAVVLTRAGQTDRMLTRICRYQLALQQDGARDAAVGAVLPGAGDPVAMTLSRASRALVTARSRGPFEIECDDMQQAPTPQDDVSCHSAGSPAGSVSAVICASTGERVGLRPIPSFGPPAATTLTQLAGRLAECAGIAHSQSGSIIVPVSAELIVNYGAVDALGVVLSATEIAPERVILCVDTAHVPSDEMRNLGVRLATPLLSHADPDLAADGFLWLPAATTSCVASDPGRHRLLTDCLSAAGERDIPVMALDICSRDDAAVLSKLGVAWMEGSAVCAPCPAAALPRTPLPSPQSQPCLTVSKDRPRLKGNGLPPSSLFGAMQRPAALPDKAPQDWRGKR